MLIEHSVILDCNFLDQAVWDTLVKRRVVKTPVDPENPPTFRFQLTGEGVEGLKVTWVSDSADDEEPIYKDHLTDD